MDAKAFLARYLAGEMRHVLRTADSATINVGHLYVQTAGYGEGRVLVETTSNSYLPAEHQLSPAAMNRLAELGFTEPDRDFPNWWIGLENPSDRDIVQAAQSVMAALVEAYGVALLEIARALGADAQYPQPLPATTASEEQQVPDPDELRRLEQRLALAESFCLEAVRTGVTANATPSHRLRDLEEEQRASAPADPFLASGGLEKVAGWENLDRFRAAEKAIGAMYWSMGADTSTEGARDELETWQALQSWLAVSPRWETDGFAILRDRGERSSYEYARVPLS